MHECTLRIAASGKRSREQELLATPVDADSETLDVNNELHLVHGQLDILRTGSEHRIAARQSVRQHVFVRSDGGAGLRRLRADDELEVDGPSVDGNYRPCRRRCGQFRLYSDDSLRSVAADDG